MNTRPRSRITVIKIKPEQSPHWERNKYYWNKYEYPIPDHTWQVIKDDDGRILDEFMTREEARNFVSAFASGESE